MLESFYNSLEFLFYLSKLSAEIEGFSTICTIIIAFMLLIICNAACSVYHVYMYHDQESGSTLLNVFHGHLAVVFQVQSSI